MTAVMAVTLGLPPSRLPSFTDDFAENDRLSAFKDLLGQPAMLSDLGFVSLFPPMSEALRLFQVHLDPETNAESTEQEAKRVGSDFFACDGPRTLSTNPGQTPQISSKQEFETPMKRWTTRNAATKLSWSVTKSSGRSANSEAVMNTIVRRRVHLIAANRMCSSGRRRCSNPSSA
jgi:hypothetical protein